MLFCGGWWCWRVGCSHCHQPSLLLQGLGPTGVSGNLLLRAHSHLKEALGQEGGSQSRKWKNLGAVEGGVASAHRGTEKLSSVHALMAVGAQGDAEGVSGACSGCQQASGLWTHTTFTVLPPTPPLWGGCSSKGVCRHGSQRESVGGCRKGREAAWAGAHPLLGGGGFQLFSKRDRRSSLLLLGRSGGSR